MTITLRPTHLVKKYHDEQHELFSDALRNISGEELNHG